MPSRGRLHSANEFQEGPKTPRASALAIGVSDRLGSSHADWAIEHSWAVVRIISLCGLGMIAQVGATRVSLVFAPETVTCWNIHRSNRRFCCAFQVCACTLDLLSLKDIHV